MTAQPKPTAAEVRECCVDTWTGGEYGYRDNGEQAGADFDRWLAEHDAQVAAEALRRKARFYRQAEEAGYLFLGESDRVPWEAVARDLDADAARVAAGEEP